MNKGNSLPMLTSVSRPSFDILSQIFGCLPLRTLDHPIVSSLFLPQLTFHERQALLGFKVFGVVTKASMAHQRKSSFPIL